MRSSETRNTSGKTRSATGKTRSVPTSPRHAVYPLGPSQVPPRVRIPLVESPCHIQLDLVFRVSQI